MKITWNMNYFRKKIYQFYTCITNSIFISRLVASLCEGVLMVDILQKGHFINGACIRNATNNCRTIQLCFHKGCPLKVEEWFYLALLYT